MKKGAVDKKALSRRILARVLAEDLEAATGSGCSSTTKSVSCGTGCDEIKTDSWKLCDDQT